MFVPGLREPMGHPALVAAVAPKPLTLIGGPG